MADYDASQAGSTAADTGPIARPDVDALPAGSFGPASGNAITGAGTITGSAGADTPGAAPASIVEVHGAGGATSAAGDNFQASGQYGVLSMDAAGQFQLRAQSRHARRRQGRLRLHACRRAGRERSPSTLTIDIGQVAAAAAGQGSSTCPPASSCPTSMSSAATSSSTCPTAPRWSSRTARCSCRSWCIGDVAVPATNLAALLIDSEPQPAAGPPQSSGGNFAVRRSAARSGRSARRPDSADRARLHAARVPRGQGQFIDTQADGRHRHAGQSGGRGRCRTIRSTRRACPRATIDGTAEPAGFRRGAGQRRHDAGRSCSRPRTASTASPSTAS